MRLGFLEQHTEKRGKRTLSFLKGKWVFLAAGACGIATAIMFSFDPMVIDWVEHLSLGYYVAPVRIVTEMGHGITILGLFLGLLVFCEEYRTAVFGLASLSIVGIVTQVLKVLFEIPRPEGSGTSFPSGHTGAAFAAAVILAARYPKLRPFFYLFAAGVAITRVVLVKHFPSDVLAGAAIGLLVGAATLAISERFEIPLNRKWLRAPAFALLLALSIYAMLGSDVPKYLVRHIAPVIMMLLAHRTAIRFENGNGEMVSK